MNNSDESSLTASKTVTETIIGTVRRVTFRSAESGYTVLQIEEEGTQTIVNVVGISVEVHADDHVAAKGTYVQHPKFGLQFKADFIESYLPTENGSLMKYLSSGLIKGIGPALAEKIVSHFGDKSQEILLSTPERLVEVAGIGEEKAKVISAVFADGGALRSIVQFLIAHGISPGFAQRILNRYGVKAVDRLRADPYILARDFKGVGFRKADAIATQELGVPLTSPLRTKAALLYVLEEASRGEGHCYLRREQLFRLTFSLIPDAQPESEEMWNEFLTELVQDNHVVIIENEFVYLTAIYDAELFVKEFIFERCREDENKNTSLTETQSVIELCGKQLDLEFTEEQVKAIEFATTSGISIITGGPGCGKTTLVRALVTIFKTQRKKILLCAPTGRAANRLQQVSGHDASTIHRALKYRSGSFFHDATEPVSCDVVIIDECSMVDIPLAAALFSAIPCHAQVILVGDKDQLPSVGPGRILADLVESEVVPCATLKTVHRRASTSAINMIAHAVNNGVLPEIPRPDGLGHHEAYFLERGEPQAIISLLQSLLSQQIPEKFGFSLNDIMLLTPTNKGPLGTESLNTSLQEVLNPPLPTKNALQVGGTLFRLGDRVCQRKNNYTIDEQGVFNGDTGTVTSINTIKKSMVVELWDGRFIEYATADLNQLSLAYALTIHRAQGSEAPCIILLLHDAHFILLDRQLVYTGITRAKQLLIIIGTNRGLQLGYQRTRGKQRNSGLGF
jgi:exodeoxyribonuclease V alpha subunit